MKAAILQSNFARTLGQVSRIISARTTLPVLSNVLISVKKGKVTLSATDLEVGITTQTVGKIEEEGELTVPARLLTDFIQNNSDETIELKTENNKINLKSAHFEANIAGIAAEEFPTVPAAPKESFCQLDSNEFLESLKRVIIAPATDETRPTLAGVFFHFEKKTLKIAATDSYRLAEKKMALNIESEEKKIIVPTRTITEVIRLISSQEKIDRIALSASENQVFFVIGDVSIVSRIIEGAFPNYLQIIPASFKITAKVEYKAVAAAVKMAALFARDAANNIRIQTSDKGLIVSSALAETGSATSNLTAAVSGGQINIAFNARYLLDVLSVVSGEIILKFNDNNSPGVIETAEDKDYLYLVMPLKIE